MLRLGEYQLDELFISYVNHERPKSYGFHLSLLSQIERLSGFVLYSGNTAILSGTLSGAIGVFHKINSLNAGSSETSGSAVTCFKS